MQFATVEAEGLVQAKSIRTIETVAGPIDTNKLGVVLSHEHVMSNFGLAIDQTDAYEEASLKLQVLPYLKRLQSLGVGTIFDNTAQYFGRRVDVLKIFSHQSQIHIVTNTGIYGAANDRYVPEFASESSAEAIAAIWVDEFENGIGETNIKPGFIKLAFDMDEVSALDKKLFLAGIFAHQKTGLTLAVHTESNLLAAQKQMHMLHEHDVGLDSWIWVHANKVDDTNILLDAAKQGAWISLDGVSAVSMEADIARLKQFRSAGLLHKVLLSHDGNAYPAGKAIRPFEFLLTDMVPMMLDSGFVQHEVDQLLKINPVQAYLPKPMVKSMGLEKID